MSNPTTPFSWQMPTATDLVTDLPADFEVFGQAVATSMADLLGGTSGQILAKNSNTDMDFTWITNDVGDITAVTAGTGISGGGTSGAVTITNDMATTITASGDIVVGTGSGTYDNLPIGTTGQLLTADTTVSPYKVKWATPAGPTVKGCSVKLTSPQATVSNTNYTVLFGGEDFDTDGYHSTVTNTGRITIPAGLGGYYLFTINNRQTTTSSQQNSISLHVNGSVIGYGTANGNFQSVVNTGGIGITLSGSIVYYATAGDYFTCVAYLGGAALSVDNAVFQAIYLGA